ncbi:uncharacterized protein LODBEIA_P57710 [Lodderomyces beijingensis]|uniref:FAD-binding FR-type domain-containing protein n=1 Tax=Lodderomyces beijingensis TaxID=1775926 RepID=A0ABP0ZTV2_9ASCO
MSEVSTIDLQRIVEGERNTKYQWISCIFSLLVFLVNGIVFFWLPRFFRQKRYTKSNRFKPYFILLNVWNSFNASWSIRFNKKTYYFKPTVLVLFLFYILLNGRLCYQNTEDITYIPRIFVVAKRCARIGVAQIPALFLLITKGDFITGITGLNYDRTTFLHVWFGFMMFTVITFHVAIVCYHWARPQFSSLHPRFPKNFYGIAAYVTFVFLAIGNMKFIRKLSYDLSMLHHRTQSFIMLLMAFLHNDTTKAMVVVGVHLLVLDKVVGRIYGIVHGKKSPTKGWSEFELLDNETLKVSIPVKISDSFNPNSWSGLLKFKYGNWKAGSHIYFNVRKVDFFQHHPFFIASLPESGKMVIIIRKKEGFTKKLFEKVEALKEKQIAGTETEADYIPIYRQKWNKWIAEYKKNKNKKKEPVEEEEEREEEQVVKLPDYRKIIDPNIVILKAAFRGPSGAKVQPLLTFDSVVLFAQACGASFVFPVVLDLLQTIERKEVGKDYLGRPPHPVLTVYWLVETEKQINWYRHLLDKLLPYVQQGKVVINVVVEEKEVEMGQVEQTSSSSSSSGQPVQTTFSSKAQEVEVEQAEVKKDSASSESGTDAKSAAADYSLLDVTFAGLDTNEALQNHISRVQYSDENHFRSMAVLACGERANFGKEIEYNLQNFRWVRKAPNMYFYNESLET